MSNSKYSIKILPTKDNGVELHVDPNTPIDVVNKTVSSLINKGLVEVLTKSTATSRVFKTSRQISKEDDEVSRAVDIFNRLTSRSSSVSHAAPSRQHPQVAQQQSPMIDFSQWVAEATKPLSSRFKSEEEALAYWNSIPLNNSAEDIDT